jgi:hypothetical protein
MIPRIDTIAIAAMQDEESARGDATLALAP